jgi:hypothetical protein
VVESVRRDVVAPRRELAHRVHVVARRHPEDEEGRLHRERVEQLQHPGELALEPFPRAIPLRVAESAGEDLVAILEVEAQKQRAAHGSRLGSSTS